MHEAITRFRWGILYTVYGLNMKIDKMGCGAMWMNAYGGDGMRREADRWNCGSGSLVNGKGIEHILYYTYIYCDLKFTL